MLIIFLAALNAIASDYDSFRCPNQSLVHVNDRISEVRIKCDPPTFARKSVENLGAVGYYDPAEMEEWTYNLGPGSFVYYLTFERGILAKITSGDYGR